MAGVAAVEVSMDKSQINKKMIISEALRVNGKTSEVLSNSGIHCAGCWISGSETIEEGCLIHGMSQREIDLIIKKINQKTNGGKK